MKLLTLFLLFIFNYVISTKSQSPYDATGFKSSFKDFGKFAHNLFKENSQCKDLIYYNYYIVSEFNNEADGAFLELSSKKLKNNKTSGNLRKTENKPSNITKVNLLYFFNFLLKLAETTQNQINVSQKQAMII
jgi:hypothetical protein